MSSPIIEVRNLSKLYHLGQIGRASLIQSARYRWRRMRGKPVDDLDNTEAHAEIDPERHGPVPNSFWAIKDVSFDVNEGEVLGIIGKNGAGKSTLLKILSRITEPTSGYAKMKGRVASLLEVGTGFHEQLTGRENIYLNGTILGLKKIEIDSKLDEIIDFSGVEKFLDTPVKRYSSGMRVRLAFAVAAHLEPEILIVDEVLAVGDAEFQKKCLGKMKDVAQNQGRTVMFVSHQMNAVRNLCPRALWIHQGTIIGDDSVSTILDSYLEEAMPAIPSILWEDPRQAPGDDILRLCGVSIKPAPTAEMSKQSELVDKLTTSTPLEITIKLNATHPTERVCVTISVSCHGQCVFSHPSPLLQEVSGNFTLKAIIPGNLLNNNKYLLTLYVRHLHSRFEAPDLIGFQPEEGHRPSHMSLGVWHGAVRPHIDWIV